MVLGATYHLRRISQCEKSKARMIEPYPRTPTMRNTPINTNSLWVHADAFLINIDKVSSHSVGYLTAVGVES